MLSKHSNAKFQNYKISNVHFFKCSIFPNFILFNVQKLYLHSPASIWEHKKRKVVTNTISYERYGEILFQKVALGYLLHFVQNGSSNNIIKHACLHNNLKCLKMTRPSFRMEAPRTTNT